MKKAMISQPMKGKTEEEIAVVKAKATKDLADMGYEVINTSFNFDDESLKVHGFTNIPLYYLAKSIEAMSKCEAVYFVDGWENARGCRIEHDAAMAYGLKIIYEVDDT